MHKLLDIIHLQLYTVCTIVQYTLYSIQYTYTVRAMHNVYYTTNANAVYKKRVKMNFKYIKYY